jgi:hypothetical protein
MEHSPGETILCFIKQTTTNVKQLKSYKIYSLTTKELYYKLVTEKRLEENAQIFGK